MNYTIILSYFISTLIKVTSAIVVYNNLAALVAHNFKLKRISKTGQIINNKIPINEGTKKKEIKKRAFNYILPYVEKLKAYTTDENLENLYRNLNTLKLKRQFFLTALYYQGFYSPRKNEIKFITKRAIGHELLHLASTYYDEKTKTTYSGFYQETVNGSIGQGIDEGYTELLASRIYNKKNKITAYRKEVKFARLLEFFFDDPKEMENYYFNHNLPGLVSHLEQYAPRDQIIKFILEIDTMNKYSDGIINILPTYNSIKAQFTLYNWYKRKSTDKDKLKQFRNIICEDKMVSLILNNQKMVINRTQPQQTNITQRKTK